MEDIIPLTNRVQRYKLAYLMIEMKSKTSLGRVVTIYNRLGEEICNGYGQEI